jgi:hypothetical protein
MSNVTVQEGGETGSFIEKREFEPWSSRLCQGLRVLETQEQEIADEQAR